MRRTTLGGDGGWSSGGYGSGHGSNYGGNLWRENNAPLTLGLIGASAALFLISFFSPAILSWLSFSAPGDLTQPWRLLTYPLVVGYGNIIGLLFYGLMLWWIGASLERSWGTPFYALFFVAMTLITALAMSLGGVLFGWNYPVGYYLPFSGLLFAWCVLNANEEIRLYGIIPILGKWLAVGEVLIIFFTHAISHPMLGVFALSGCGAALWWTRSRAWGNVNLYSTMPTWRWGLGRRETRAKPRLKLVPKKNARAASPPDDRRARRSFNPLRWWKRRQERKQFEKLVGGD